jgi:hypothetical protein
MVYGVEVPGADGRAGMALLTIDGGLNLDALARGLETLPYTRSLFLRIAHKIEATETLQAEAAGLRRGQQFRPHCPVIHIASYVASDVQPLQPRQGSIGSPRSLPGAPRSHWQPAAVPWNFP